MRHYLVTFNGKTQNVNLDIFTGIQAIIKCDGECSIFKVAEYFKEEQDPYNSGEFIFYPIAITEIGGNLKLFIGWWRANVLPSQDGFGRHIFEIKD